MCSKQAIVCISKNKIPLPLEEAKTAQGDAAFMKHLTKPLYLYFLSSQIFIISQNCCKSEETITISKILAFWSDIYTLHSNIIIQVKKIKCTAVLIQAKTVLHLHNCPQDNYYILQISNEIFWNGFGGGLAFDRQLFCAELCSNQMPREVKALKSGENFRCWKHIWKQIQSNQQLRAENKGNKG